MDLNEYIHTNSNRFKRHPWELARLKMLKFFIQKSNPKPARVVDIGSGDAFLAAGVAEKYMSINVSAVDINYNEELISIIRTGKPANLAFYRKIDEIQQAEPINIVILMDVLEHVEKPIDMLEKIIQLKAVNKETLFVITVPAYQKLFSKHDVNLGHFKRYNLKEIKSVLISSNLTVIASGYSFSSLLLIRRLHIYWEKRRKARAETSTSINNWKRGRFLTWLISQFFWFEFKISWYLALTGIKIPGLSCYCICRPSQS